MRTFDEWIRNGLHRARQHHPGEWEKVYDQTPPIRFLFWGHGQQSPNALLGVLRPSRDRGGRTYPFIVAGEIPKRRLPRRDLPSLPVQAESFYAAADRIGEKAVEGSIPHQEIANRVEHIDNALGASTSPSKRHRGYLQQKTVRSFFEELFGHFSDGGKYRLFNNLLQILQPLREDARIKLNYGLQFPLSCTQTSCTSLTSFWLDVSLRLLDYPSAASPTVFWTPRQSPGSSPFMLLFLGTPRPRAFFHLLAPDDPHESVYPLAEASGRNDAEAALAIPEEYGSLLENEALSLHQFLQRL
jgi:type VI secretion system ImpM family protein